MLDFSGGIQKNGEKNIDFLFWWLYTVCKWSKRVVKWSKRVGGEHMIGKYGAKLDEKNRLFVPSKLRSELGAIWRRSGF